MSGYDADLSKLRANELTYREFERRHRGIVRSIALRWQRHAEGIVDVGDLCQDVLEATWRAVDAFEPCRGVPLSKWVRKCVRHKLMKQVARARKRRGVEAKHIEHFGARDDSEIDDFLADTEDVVRFRRRLDTIMGTVDRRTGRLVFGIVAGHGLERVRQEVYSDYTIAGAIRKSRTALRQVMKVAEGLED